MTAAMVQAYLRKFLADNYQGKRSQFEFEGYLITIEKKTDVQKKSEAA